MTDPHDPGHLDDRIMTANEVAAWLTLSVPNLNRRIKAGDLPASRIGGERRFWRPLLRARLFPQEAAVEPDHDDPEVITPEDLATALRLTPQTIWRRIQDGSIPASKIGNQYRIYWPTIRARLEAGEDFVPRERPVE